MHEIKTETFRVLIPGPGDPPKDPATTAERWLLKLISYLIFFRKFPVSLPVLHYAITSPCSEPVFTTATTVSTTIFKILIIIRISLEGVKGRVLEPFPATFGRRVHPLDESF